MKKHFIYFIAVATTMVATALNAANNNDNGVENDTASIQITMTTKDVEVQLLLLGGGRANGKAFIDWGDDLPTDTVTLWVSGGWSGPRHTYTTDKDEHIITITGDNIYGLVCFDNKLTNLKVSNNNTIKILDCTGNQLSAAALNDLFETLPNNSSGGRRDITIARNPGESDCNIVIAQAKGWTVSVSGSRTGTLIQAPNRRE